MQGLEAQNHSADACRRMASDLRRLADEWDRRAEKAARDAAAYAARFERPRAVRIAKRAVVLMQYGMDAMRYCEVQATEYNIPIATVTDLFSQYQAKAEVEKRLRRNRHIAHMVKTSGLKQVDIARRFGLSSAQISKIINPPAKPKRRALPVMPKKRPQGVDAISLAIERASRRYSSASDTPASDTRRHRS